MLEEMMRLVRLREGQGLVFTTETGARSTPPTSFRQRSFAQLLKRARLGRARFHDLRQTFATLLFSQNTYPPSASRSSQGTLPPQPGCLPVTRSHRVRKTMRLGLQKTRCHEVC